MPSGKARQAMAWVVNLGTAPGEAAANQPVLHPEVLKDGGTVGFSSVIVLNPFKDAAIFIAVNESGKSPTGIGVAIGRHLP